MTRTIGLRFHHFRTCRVAMAAAAIALTYASSTRAADITPTSATHEPECSQRWTRFSPISLSTPTSPDSFTASLRMVSSCTFVGSGFRIWSRSALNARDAVSHRLNDEGIHGAHGSEASRRWEAPVGCACGEVRPGTSWLELPNAGLATNTRPRPPEPHRRLRYRRSVGRSTNAAARDRVLEAAT